jgi:hypothetical protein
MWVQAVSINNISAGALTVAGPITATGTISTTGTITATGAIATSAYFRLPPTTVSLLSAAATVGAGALAFVTDASSPVFGANVVGGGTTKIPVYSDGVSWLVR